MTHASKHPYFTQTLYQYVATCHCVHHPCYNVPLPSPLGPCFTSTVGCSTRRTDWPASALRCSRCARSTRASTSMRAQPFPRRRGRRGAAKGGASDEKGHGTRTVFFPRFVRVFFLYLFLLCVLGGVKETWKLNETESKDRL